MIHAFKLRHLQQHVDFKFKERTPVLRSTSSWLIASTLMVSVGTSDVVLAKSHKPKDSVRYTVPTPGSSIDAGAARIRVKATPKELLQLVTDYGNYSKFITRFSKARVIGRKGSAVDVYLQVPILKGMAKIWAVVRFEKPHMVAGEQLVEGHLVKGNVERLDATWRIRRIDAESTQLNLEMLIVPKLPVPGSLVTGEVAYAADRAVSDVRKEAEKH